MNRMYMTIEEAEACYGPMVRFYKEKSNEMIWHTYPVKENFVTYFFSFDRKIIYEFWTDFPQNLTGEEIYTFTKENPRMAELRGCRIIHGKLNCES
ncbi:DUF7675 family protein [Absicoccus intestinalis]|uniref:DUF7675 domain-containing protein n=2 Tax=Absicoccus TaxID=2718525 RepID=A0ABU4WQN5_9FIRM|nr:hypothetical protein [Absicoccus sp. CLA-KB-P134]MDX8417719.1 hypothetical protein [Absicoccus sp. CLA-KB-P134]